MVCDGIQTAEERVKKYRRERGLAVMWTTFIVVVLGVSALVMVARYREIPEPQRPTFVHWLLRRKNRYPLDESAKLFAEQWQSHPTLTRRQAKAIEQRKNNNA